MRMKLSISTDRCQGHGRCYDLAPELFGEDAEGYGVVLAGPTPGQEAQARLAALNCPENAIDLGDQ
jgi:ferredoxin